MEYKIERLKPKDFSKCGNIWDMSKKPDMARRFYRELVSGNRITFVYIRGDEFMGEASLMFDRNDPDYTIQGKRIYLSRMVVKKSHRRQGIGTALLKHVCSYASNLGYAEMSLGVDVRNGIARKLYADNGFNREIFLGSDEYGEYIKLLKKL
jgi:ribosomal protein S18 acetylase RimI-like enzyme